MSNCTLSLVIILYCSKQLITTFFRYNPAPSVLHHPQTTLRDPMYWYMIENLLKYFTEYSNTLEPYDFSRYQSQEFDIIDFSFTKMNSYFESYEFSINNIFQRDNIDYKISPLIYTVRQKRLKHMPFKFAFTVDSRVNKTVLVKLFIGPQCKLSSCFDEYSKFYELDSFTQKLQEDLNIIKYSNEFSTKYSFDDHYNMEQRLLQENRFDTFKFPASLIIPKGLSQGLNLTLFVLLTPIQEKDDPNLLIYLSEPFGFPFHRKALINENINFNNYKFFNITIFHKESLNEENGYFSPYLI